MYFNVHGNAIFCLWEMSQINKDIPDIWKLTWHFRITLHNTLEIDFETMFFSIWHWNGFESLATLCQRQELESLKLRFANHWKKIAMNFELPDDITYGINFQVFLSPYNWRRMPWLGPLPEHVFQIENMLVNRWKGMRRSHERPFLSFTFLFFLPFTWRESCSVSHVLSIDLFGWKSKGKDCRGSYCSVQEAASQVPQPERNLDTLFFSCVLQT